MPLSAATRALLLASYRFWPSGVDLAERAGFRCEYCERDLLGSLADYYWNWETDHIVPRSADGADEPSNWALTCRLCNQLKGSWDPRPTAADAADRDTLVAAARAHVSERRAEREVELAEVRALVEAELSR